MLRGEDLAEGHHGDHGRRERQQELAGATRATGEEVPDRKERDRFDEGADGRNDLRGRPSEIPRLGEAQVDRRLVGAESVRGK